MLASASEVNTTLAVLQGEDDPGLALPRQLLAEWLQHWGRHPEHHRRIARAWIILYADLQKRPPAKRWAKVRCAISAVICALLTIGWDAPKATEWQSDIGELWKMGDLQEVDDGELLDEICESIRRDGWTKASQHEAGLGLQDGANLH